MIGELSGSAEVWGYADKDQTYGLNNLGAN